MFKTFIFLTLSLIYIKSELIVSNNVHKFERVTNYKYDTRFYIHNNVTGSGYVLRDIAYDAICSGMKDCKCCIGYINEIRCGNPLICELLNEFSASAKSYGPGTIVIYILGTYISGFKMLALGIRAMRQNKGMCCRWFGGILIIIGLVATFPFGLLMMCCLDINLPDLKCCCKCKKGKAKTSAGTEMVPKLYNDNPQPHELPIQTNYPDIVVEGEFRKYDVAEKENSGYIYQGDIQINVADNNAVVEDNANPVAPATEEGIVGEKDNVEVSIIIERSIILEKDINEEQDDEQLGDTDEKK
jgi:hypothetical protein